MLKSRNQW
jgi:ABC-type transporter Mla maintaining outer membrane lipid asymmetry permease subunit MlaE